MNSNIIHKINKICHENNKGFIYASSLGLMGFAFSDLVQSIKFWIKLEEKKGNF